METKDYDECLACGKLIHISEQRVTTEGDLICSYECIEAWYGDESDVDFKKP